MGILKVYEFGQDRTASEQRQLDGQTDTYRSTVSRGFCVETDADTVTQVEVRDAVDPSTSVAIPASGDPHPENSFLFALGFDISHIGSLTTFWKVIVTYESITLAGAEDPLAEPKHFELDTDEREIPIDRDYFDGRPIVNQAGDEPDEPVKGESSDWVMTVSWNVASVNGAYLRQFRGRVNNVALTINTPLISLTFPAYTARCRKIRLSEVVRGSLTYYRMTVVIAERSTPVPISGGGTQEIGWRHIYWNKGYNVLVSAGNYLLKRPLYDEHGMPLKKPAFLNNAGTAVVASNDTANLIRLFIDKYPLTDLNPLFAYTG